MDIAGIRRSIDWRRNSLSCQRSPIKLLFTGTLNSICVQLLRSVLNIYSASVTHTRSLSLSPGGTRPFCHLHISTSIWKRREAWLWTSMMQWATSHASTQRGQISNDTPHHREWYVSMRASIDIDTRHVWRCWWFLFAASFHIALHKCFAQLVPFNSRLRRRRTTQYWWRQWRSKLSLSRVTRLQHLLLQLWGISSGTFDGFLQV